MIIGAVSQLEAEARADCIIARYRHDRQHAARAQCEPEVHAPVQQQPGSARNIGRLGSTYQKVACEWSAMFAASGR